MTDQTIIPLLTLTENGEVIQHDGSRVYAEGSTSALDGPVLGSDPENGVRAIEQRLAFLRAEVEAHTFKPNGEKVHALPEQKRAAYLREIESIETISLPYQRQCTADLLARQEAARAAQADSLQREQALRDEVERRAMEKALNDAAEKRAAQLSRDMRLPK